MLELYDQIQEAVRFIRTRWDGKPRVGIVLGTGLGGPTETMRREASIPYAEIPHFAETTSLTHKGQLIFGKLGGQTVMTMEGRCHAYEGYSMKQITFPVRVMKALGCEVLIVSNACGGLNPQYATTDLMIIEDHINLMGDNPLIGKNDDRLGPRFPDMCYPYDRELIELAQRIALEERIACHKGVYVAVVGPNLETRAEYRFLRGIGADVVGMSTVPETIVAAHCGLRVLGISVVTDMCLPDALEPASVPDILAAANAVAPRLQILIRRVLESLPRPV